MCRPKFYLLYVLVAAMLGPLLIASCTNDLKKIQEIAGKQATGGADTARVVNILISDSGRVKAQITAPQLLTYSLENQNKDSYKLMPQGVKIVMFDRFHQEQANIVADTGYYYDIKNQVKFFKHVVITSKKGDVVTTEELIYDMATHKIWSTKDVDFKMADGNHGHGTSLETNESFFPLHMTNSTGLINLDYKSGQ